MSYFVFIRHGLSQANVDQIVAGHFDTPLTDVGRQQARDVTSVLRDIGFHHAYGSPLQRAKETLEIILGQLQNGIEPSFHDELKERNWGEIEGKPADNRSQEYPQAVIDSWFEWNGRPPGGESYSDMSERIVQFFDNVVLPHLKGGQNVLMVAHNGISKPLQRHIQNLPHESTNTLNIGNCEVKLYKFDEEGKLLSTASRVVKP